MDGEQKFWLSMWLGIGALMVGAVGIVAISEHLSYVERARAVTEMVEQGANPMIARCALTGAHSLHCQLTLAQTE